MTVSDARKSRILALRAEGFGYGAIAASVGNVSRSYVQQVCNGSVPPPRAVDLDEVKRVAREIKQEKVNQGVPYGTLQVLSDLVERGYNPADLPSLATLGNWFDYGKDGALSVRRVSIRSGSKKARYWFEARPERHGERALIDTATVVVAGESYEMLLMIDWFSRIAHIEILPRQWKAT